MKMRRRYRDGGDYEKCDLTYEEQVGIRRLAEENKGGLDGVEQFAEKWFAEHPGMKEALNLPYSPIL